MVIFLYGADTFRSQKKLQEIKKKFLEKKSIKNINLETYEAKELDRNHLHSILFTQGFGKQVDKKRLIVLKGLFENSINPDFYFDLSQFIKEDNQNILIIYEKEISPKALNAAAKKLYLLLLKKATCQKFDLLKEQEIKKFIEEELRKNNITINPIALNLISQHTKNLWQAHNQTNEIISWALFKNKKYISEEDISNFYSNGLISDEIFSLFSAIEMGQKKQALYIITHLLQQGESIDKLIFTLSRQFQVIFRVKKGLEKTQNRSLLSRQLKLHPYYLSKMINCSFRYNLKQLKKVHHEFLLIDLKRKTTKTNPELLLDILISHLI